MVLFAYSIEYIECHGVTHKSTGSQPCCKLMQLTRRSISDAVEDEEARAICAFVVVKVGIYMRQEPRDRLPYGQNDDVCLDEN